VGEWVYVGGGAGVLLEYFLEHHWPTGEAADHATTEDEVKGLRPRPFLLQIIYLKGTVRRDTERLSKDEDNQSASGHQDIRTL